MILHRMRMFNFQCFGPEPLEINLETTTFLIGPNGSGKTAAMQALCRLFAFNPGLRRVQKSDFHVPHGEDQAPEERELWIEVEFLFPELKEGVGEHPTVPPHFGHMRLDEADGIPRVRFRLDASMGIDGDIEESLQYVLDENPDGSPLSTAPVSRLERNNILVHYLPARRDPAEHIAFGANALLGRLLKAISWDAEREVIKALTGSISESLATNKSVTSLSKRLSEAWRVLHKGSYFADPSITFVTSEIEALLRHLSISFEPGHDEQLVDFSRLSDGQKSMLYLSLVLSSQAIGKAVLQGTDNSFDPDKLRPAVFTIVAMEEPENSLSPHYLGRIVSILDKLVGDGDAQALIATHAPSMLRRVEPENIRYLRLNEERKTTISSIDMPSAENEAHKFVREAVQAFPEVYFSRLVLLGEGDSEEIVLTRILKAKGLAIDESAICVTPLGGRHVNHFWRLLTGLGIPFVTLLDMDLARFRGGWGRVQYVNNQLEKYSPENQLPSEMNIPAWDNDEFILRDYVNYIDALEQRGIFFSSPLDLDFTMLASFPNAYEVNSLELALPTENKIKSVLGDHHHGINQYSEEEQKLFNDYHRLFKLGSKPSAHINALSRLEDSDLLKNLPASLERLAESVKKQLEELSE